MRKHLLAIALALASTIQPVWAANAEIFHHPEDIKGIVAVHTKGFKEHWWSLPPERKHWWSLQALKHYTYEADSGEQFETTERLKHVKDLRPYENRHPYYSQVEAACKHLAPVAETVGGFLIPTLMGVSYPRR